MRRGAGRSNKGGKSRAILGEHNVISDISGFKFKSSEMRRGVGLQKGLLMHRSEWSPENPQLHIRVRPDDTSVQDVRERGVDQFVPEAEGDYAFQNGDDYAFNAPLFPPMDFN